MTTDAKVAIASLRRQDGKYLVDPEDKLGLRVKHSEIGHPIGTPYGDKWRTCKEAGCPGWHPTDDIGVLLDCLIELGYEPRPYRTVGRAGINLYMANWGQFLQVSGIGATWADALWDALRPERHPGLLPGAQE